MQIFRILIAVFLVVQAVHADIGDSRQCLTGKKATEHFQVLYRPGSRAGAAVDRIAHLLESEYAEILKMLKIAGKVDESGPFYMFLYDSSEEMGEITGVKGTGGFSAGRETHIPWDNDQTRKHELVHIVVAAMEKTGSEARNMFFAEGIANAVLEYVHGIPVHSVAAYEKKRGTLPSLQTMLEHPDFYAFLSENPGLNAYDVAGSFFLYLLETFDPGKVMAFYHGKPVRKALGRTIDKIERGWHKRLDAFPVRPELHTLLSIRRGDGGEFNKYSRPEKSIPADLLGKPGDWLKVQGGLQPAGKIGTWEIGRDKAEAENSNGSEWSAAVLPDLVFGNCAVKVRAKAHETCWGVKILYGECCEALVFGHGSFIYTPEGGIAFTEEMKLAGGSQVDLVLHVQNGHADMYVNGKLLLAADLKLEPSRLGVAVVGGKAAFTGFAVRKL